MPGDTAYHVMILGGDAPTRDMLRFLLEDKGCEARDAATLADMPHALMGGGVALVVIVLEAPHGDLTGTMTALRSLGYEAPVVVLSHEVTHPLRRHAFALGVRDVISLPASARDLQARLLTLAGASAGQRTGSRERALRAGGLTLHAASCDVRDGVGWSVRLTTREAALLAALMECPGQPVARNVLLDRVWGEDYEGDGSVLDVYATRLRRKLARPEVLRAVRGRGYAFDARTSPRPASIPEVPGPPQVLIVDDDPDTVTMLAETLDEAGYGVVAALGRQALLLARQLRPAVILLDIMMPGIDGPELRRQLREHPRTASIPVIALSAGRTLRDHAAAMNASDYLSKPFDLEEVLLRVEKWAGPPVPAARQAIG